MTLKQQLVEDMKAAMKGGDKHTLGVVRLINAEDSAVPAVQRRSQRQRAAARRAGDEHAGPDRDQAEPGHDGAAEAAARRDA